jgi:hypothetical protein
VADLPASRCRWARRRASNANACCRLPPNFELAETSFPTVDSKGCMKVRTNWYSTTLQPGTRCQARLLPAYVEIWQEGECVARQKRSFGRYEQVLEPVS